MACFGLKYRQDLENRAAHPYREFRGVPPPPPSRVEVKAAFGDHEEYMMFLNDEEYDEVESWIEDCTSDYTRFSVVVIDDPMITLRVTQSLKTKVTMTKF